MNKKEFSENLNQAHYELIQVYGLLNANDAVINDLTRKIENASAYNRDYKAALNVLLSELETALDRLNSVSYFAQENVDKNIDRLDLLNLNYTTNEDVKGDE